MMKSKLNITIDFLVRAAILLFALAMGFLAVHSLSSTVGMDMANHYQERVFFLGDSLLANLGLLLLFAALGLLLWRVLPRLSYRLTLLCGGGAVLVLGLLYVLTARSAPSADSWIVTNAGYQAANGNFAAVTESYFQCYPFQLGYVLYTEILCRILDFGGNFMFIGVLNVLFLVGMELSLCGCVRLVTGSEAGAKLTMLLFVLCLQPMIFSTFLYGNLPGVALSAVGMYLALRFLQEERIWAGGLSALCLGLGVSLKLNASIAVVAVCIVAALQGLSRCRFRLLLLIPAAVACVLLCKSLPVWIYQARTGFAFGQGAPMVCWLVLGMGDAGIAPGWWDMYADVRGGYLAAGMDGDAAAAAALEKVMARLEVFADNPGYCKQFFTEKFLTQWNETTYQSLWNTQVRGFYGSGPLPPASYLIGAGADGVQRYMDGYAQGVFVFAALWGVGALLRERLSPTALLLPVYLLGGMLYHLIFEAKSQYALTYFVFMIPLAAMAMCTLFDCGERLWRATAARRKNSNPKEAEA